MLCSGRPPLERRACDDIDLHRFAPKVMTIVRGSHGTESESVRRIPRQHAEVEIELATDRRNVVPSCLPCSIAHLAPAAHGRTPRRSVIAEQRQRASIEEERQDARRLADEKQWNAILGRSGERANASESAGLK